MLSLSHSVRCLHHTFTTSVITGTFLTVSKQTSVAPLLKIHTGPITSQTTDPSFSTHFRVNTPENTVPSLSFSHSIMFWIYTNMAPKLDTTIAMQLTSNSTRPSLQKKPVKKKNLEDEPPQRPYCLPYLSSWHQYTAWISLLGTKD